MKDQLLLEHKNDQLILCNNPDYQLAQKNFPKIDPTTTCNGKVHRQLRYCKKPAGWGTDHKGKGRCKLHGGCCTGPKSGRLRYSEFVPSALIEKYEEFSVESDTDIKSLNDEIALIRAKITVAEGLNQNNTYNKEVMQMCELVRRLIETKQKVEEGIKSKIKVEVVVKMVDSVITIVDRRVSDPEIKKQIAGDMRRLNLAQMNLN